MPAIMKLVNYNGATQYIPHPGRLLEIRDHFGSPLEDGVAGCRVSWDEGRFNSHRTHMPNVTARQMKRSIQDGVEDPVYFIKFEYDHPKIKKGLRYINVDHLRVIEPATITKDVDGKQVKINGTRIHTTNEARFNIDVEHPLSEVAVQVRRVLKRLEQDQDLCCSAPADDD